MKRCTKCGEEKLLDQFPPRKTRKDGRCSHCRACNREKTRRWLLIPENKERSKAAHRETHARNRDAMNAGRKARYHAAMKDPVKKQKHLASGLRWKQENPERMKALSAAWTRNNPDKNAARVRRRYAVKMQAMPKWVDPAAFIPIYKLAADATALTGEQYHVDHIVPLRGRSVSGLHVPWNLRVIPARENIRKGAKMLEEIAA